MEVSIFYFHWSVHYSCEPVQWLAGTISRCTVQYRSGGPVLVVGTVQKCQADNSSRGTVQK